MLYTHSCNSALINSPLCISWQMITVNASLFPSSVTNSLIAVGNDGLQERDRMVRACIAIICELGKNLEEYLEHCRGLFPDEVINAYILMSQIVM